MNRILIAAIAALSFAGVASAQSPANQAGSTRVGAQSQTQSPSNADRGVDFTTTGSISPDRAPDLGGYGANVTKDDLHR